MSLLRKISAVASVTFAFWALAAALVGYDEPQTFQFVLPYIKLGLGVIMFGMGATLKPEDFLRVFSRPKEVLIGVGAQFLIMPLLAWLLVKAFSFGPELAVGFLLLGACPGGTASNVMAYLAKADVALSVTMTSVTTFMAPLITPAIVWLLAGREMDVQFWSLFLSILQIVFIPLLLGLVVNWNGLQRLIPRGHLTATILVGLGILSLAVAVGMGHDVTGKTLLVFSVLLALCFGYGTERFTGILPLLSIATIVLIVGAVVGKSAPTLHQTGMLVIAGVCLHNGFGLFFGYGLAGLFRLAVSQRRTIAIEVGMQNSGLAAALAVAHFSPEAAVPAALFSVWHNLSGPVVASIWSRKSAGREG